MQSNVDFTPELALVVLGALRAAELQGWKAQPQVRDRLIDDGFNASLRSHNPQARMEKASDRAALTLEASGTQDAKTMLVASALLVLLAAVEGTLGTPVPATLLAAIAVVLDPLEGLLGRDRAGALDCTARAFSMRDQLGAK